MIVVILVFLSKFWIRNLLLAQEASFVCVNILCAVLVLEGVIQLKPCLHAAYRKYRTPSVCFFVEAKF